MSHLLYLMFRCDFDTMESLENLWEVNTACKEVSMKILPVLGGRQRKARGKYGFLVGGPPLLQACNGRRVKEVTGVPLWGLGSSTALGQ